MSTLADVAQSVVKGQMDKVKEHVQNLIDAGNAPLDIINNGLIEGMNVVGVHFKAGDMFVPEVLKSAKVMAAGVELVKPLIDDSEEQSKGVIVLGTVKGDLHDIGKNLVNMMMTSSGFKVIDIGIDMPPEKFADAIREHKPQILAMSALLTSTVYAMDDTIKYITTEGLRDRVKVIIGGAPITQEFAESIGADGFAPDAASAVDLCKELV
ncbi:MAG: cobalamin-binding protein [Firmicutes bacterium HGW-Firmicutes-14]|nr:MAG: cobalamin-binding protein [Firmicutes bacterium HGW-Firmicutes-14]